MLPNTGDTSTGDYGQLNNGVFKDRAGWDDPKTVPQYNYDAVRLQTFIVRYQGVNYPLSTIFVHENSVVNGRVTNTVRDIPVYTQ